MPATDELPLFPLQTVLFPGGLLGLKVFEARYLDLIATCLREHGRFGVVSLLRGTEVHQADKAVDFAPVGVEAEVVDADSPEAGILMVRCRGGRRFEVGSSRQQADRLWLATTTPLPDDEPLAPPPALEPCARALVGAIRSIEEQQAEAFLEPYRFDDAGWVANRWCEILPIPTPAKQKLMALPDPLLRLELVDEFLRKHKLLS
jgi:Lon protease-like protein